jgi:hypothetical protein
LAPFGHGFAGAMFIVGSQLGSGSGSSGSGPVPADTGSRASEPQAATATAATPSRPALQSRALPLPTRWSQPRLLVFVLPVEGTESGIR